MLVLGIETSCDETGVALYDGRLLAHAVHSQVAMHEAYGGVVPELASRDHIQRLVPLTRHVLARAGRRASDLAGIGYTEGPGLAGALLVGASYAHALGEALGLPVLGIHHLEGHLLSPLLSARRPNFPFVALLVSGGHTQLMRVDGVGAYRLLGETQDDAAGEAFDKTAKLLGLGYPGGPALSALAERGTPGRYPLPRLRGLLSGAGALHRQRRHDRLRRRATTCAWCATHSARVHRKAALAALGLVSADARLRTGDEPGDIPPVSPRKQRGHHQHA